MSRVSLPVAELPDRAPPPESSEPGPPERARRRRPLQRHGWLAAVLILPAAVVVFGLVTWPVLRTGWLSVHQVLSPMPGAPQPFYGAHNFMRALSDPVLRTATWHTIYFTLVSTALELTLGILFGLLMAQRLRWRWILRAAILLPWALPTVVSASMWRYILNANYGPLNALLTQLGMVDQYVPWLGQPTLALNMIIVADVWKNTSIVAFFVLAGLMVIPTQIREAAEVDGAGAWRRFRSILLPLLKPVIMVVLVLRTIEAFKVFDIVYVMTRGGPSNGTLTVAVYAYQMAFSNLDLGYGSAIAVLIVIVVLILAVIYIRMLSVGGMKEESR